MKNRDTATIIPTMRYADATAAIAFLEKAFGFERHLVVPGEKEGEVAHAQLCLGDAMIMLGSWRDDAFGRLQKLPRDVGGVVTQSPYVIVEDADAHHDRAVAAGAEVVTPLESPDYGGRMYSCRDPEGHLWTFGTYDPWAPTS